MGYARAGSSPALGTIKQKALDSRAFLFLQETFCCLFFLDPFRRDVDLYHFRGRPKVIGNAVVFQGELAGKLEALALPAPWVWTSTNLYCFQRDGFCDAFQGEIACYIGSVLPSFLNVGAYESRLGEFVSIQKICSSKVLVTFGMVGVDTSNVDFCSHAGIFDILLIIDEFPSELVELPQQPAIAKVFDLELNECVRAFRIQLVGGGCC